MTWANGKSIGRKLASLISMMLALVIVAAFPVRAHAQENSSKEFEAIELLSQKGLSVKSISLGNTFSGALMDDGSLWMWGDNSFGQLGDGTTDERHEPVMIIESGVEAISLGSFHTAALMDDGSLWTWGANTYGQLGDGTTTDRHEPVKVIESNVDVVTLGDRYSAAILDDGSLWTWGQNWNGQLGDGTTENRNEPTKVIDNGVKSASIGFSHSAALMEDGSLKMWGSGEFGELGDGLNKDYSKPVTVIASGVQSVAVDSTYSAVVMTDGSLWMFGANDSGQLGDGTIEVRHEPIRVIGSGVESVSLGGSSSSVVMTDGSLWMWGSNLNGELGDGTTEERHQPVEIIDSGVEAVTLGAFSTAMIKDDGSVWMWGRNDYGQLGDGTTDERHEPVMIFAPTEAPVDPSTIIPAYEPIVHLAASFLTEFNVGTGFEDASVNDYLQSGAFVDRAIWDNSPQTFEDFFSQTVGAYEIVSARVFSYKGAPHIALKNPVSNDLIVAFSKGGPELLESTGVTTYFNDAASTLSSIGRKFPNSTIYLAGENVGGLAASYLSTATHYRATTFNSPAVASTLLTALTQPVSLSMSNSFRGIDDTYCVNYYTEDYGERLGYSEDIAVSALVNANPLGETDELTAFFEYEGNQYSFCSYALSIPDAMKLFGIVDFDSAADAQLEMYDASLYEMILVFQSKCNTTEW